METTIVDWPLVEPPQFEPYWFEYIDLQKARLWALEHRASTNIYIGLTYLILVWLGKQRMKSYTAYELDRPVLSWNIFLASFSLMGVVRAFPEFYQILSQPNGLHRSVCVREGLNQPAAFWGFMFTLSKFVHFGDTVFIILRKKKLTFLHCYHHFSVPALTFYIFPEGEPMARWAGIMNFFVHFMMYSYYAAVGLGIRPPKMVKIFITSSELIHFLIGLTINIYTVGVLATGGTCARTWNSIKIQLIVGPTYLLLFMHFFYENYMIKRKKL